MGSLRDDLAVPGLEVAETHTSWVFLAEREVWKVKKPVSLGFLDFSTAPKRKAACEAEVRLNLRLAPDVYRGVVPITVDSSGCHRLGGSGVPVDWAVHMDRLADADRADVRLREGRLSNSHVTRVAEHIAAFHISARSDEQSAHYGSVDAITRVIRDNLDVGRMAACDLLGETDAQAVEAEQLGFLSDHVALFEGRIGTGHIREGHGDLRLEHVYLGDDDGIRILDCIEFNDRFRFVDVCSDVVFLSMDLAYHGRGDLAELFLARYAQVSNDYDLYPLVGFYESYRAYVRGMVNGILIKDEGLSALVRKRVEDEARRYYRLAFDSLRVRFSPPARTPAPASESPSLSVSDSGVVSDVAVGSDRAERLTPPPMVLAIGGIIASGKSTIAERVGSLMMAPVVGSDRTRKWLLGVDPTESARSEVSSSGSASWTGGYSDEMTERVYEEAFRRARLVLRSGRPVVIDASFRTSAYRDVARELARGEGVPFLFVECRASSDLIRERLALRDREPSVSDARAEFLDDFATAWEPVDELERFEHIVIDTSGSIEANMERVRSAFSH